MPMTIQEFVDSQQGHTGLHWIAGRSGAARTVGEPDRNTVDQVGYLNLIHPQRVSVCGPDEIAYYNRPRPAPPGPPAGGTLRGQAAGADRHQRRRCAASLVERCDEEGQPLLGTGMAGARVIESLRYFLSKNTADSTSMHGVLMDVLGMGVLISGDSGLGKSELALELISRGHGLVADDVVEIDRIGPNSLEGRCPPLLQGLLEVRGLGLIDIKTVFGETAVRRKMRLKLIVHLVRRSTMEDQYERLPLQELTQDVLGVPVRKVAIPGGGRAQPGGADGGGRAGHRAVAARHRHHARVREAPAAGDQRLGHHAVGYSIERLLPARSPPPAAPSHRRCALSLRSCRRIAAPGQLPSESHMQLIIVTGISGSGKSLAINVLEDAGFFCIDNLPVQYLLDVAMSLEKEGQDKVAVSVDARVGKSLAGLRDVVTRLRDQGHDLKVLFLNARTDALVQRYSETRRRHPLTLPSADDTGPTLSESIERERELMSEIEDLGLSIDTSDLHPNTLRQWVRDVVKADRATMTLLFESFAFKHGVPLDADLVFDVRCLPNPYYTAELRPLTGLDKPVARLPRVDSAGRQDGRRHQQVPRGLAAALRAGQSPLPDRRDRLHRRPASLGLHRRGTGAALRADRARARAPSGAGRKAAGRHREPDALTSPASAPEAVNGLAIFPLSTILFPGGVLPLRVFEARYMDMVRECMKHERPFGVCQISHGHDAGLPAEHERVGCLAQITEWDMEQLGLLRLRVARRAALHHPRALRREERPDPGQRRPAGRRPRSAGAAGSRLLPRPGQAPGGATGAGRAAPGPAPGCQARIATNRPAGSATACASSCRYRPRPSRSSWSWMSR